MVKKRLDVLLVERKLCDSRQQAQRLIRAGEVMVAQQIVDKPGTEIKENAVVTVKERSPYVSRGGEKLAKAIKEFPIEIKGRICLDGGISTGGFTDCLLQNGAQKVYGIDVGYGQVAWSIRQDHRVFLHERTNLRYATPKDIYATASPDASLGVVDVSFISLTKILPAMWTLLTNPRDVIALVKPQFEVGREKVGKKGVVRDTNEHAWAITQVANAAQSIGWQPSGLTWSPIVGPAGNIEYLLLLSNQETNASLTDEYIAAITSEARKALT